MPNFHLISYEIMMAVKPKDQIPRSFNYDHNFSENEDENMSETTLIL